MRGAGPGSGGRVICSRLSGVDGPGYAACVAGAGIGAGCSIILKVDLPSPGPYRRPCARAMRLAVRGRFSLPGVSWEWVREGSSFVAFGWRDGRRDELSGGHPVSSPKSVVVGGPGAIWTKLEGRGRGAGRAGFAGGCMGRAIGQHLVVGQSMRSCVNPQIGFARGGGCAHPRSSARVIASASLGHTP